MNGGIIMKKLVLLLSLCVLSISGFACAMEYPGDKGSGKRLLELASELEKKKSKTSQEVEEELLPIECTDLLGGNFVAEIKKNGFPIAHVYYGPESDTESDDEAEGKIKSLTVSKKERRKGHATRLINFACDELKKDGFEVVSLAVEAKKNKAINLYEKLGFEKSDEFGHEKVFTYFKELEDKK